MSTMEFLYLCGVIAAFLAFGLALAWAQYQTQNFVRPEASQGATSTDDHGFKNAA
jgi:hypothetical protein